MVFVITAPYAIQLICLAMLFVDRGLKETLVWAQKIANKAQPAPTNLEWWLFIPEGSWLIKFGLD
jgi:hypothetical protein